MITALSRSFVSTTFLMPRVVLVQQHNSVADFLQVLLISLFQIALCTLGTHLNGLGQVGHEGLEGRVYKEGLLVQAQRVVPLVDLALGEGDYVDVTSCLRLFVVDHLDEVVLLVFLIVRQASTLVYELDL